MEKKHKKTFKKKHKNTFKLWDSMREDDSMRERERLRMIKRNRLLRRRFSLLKNHRHGLISLSWFQIFIVNDSFAGYFNRFCRWRRFNFLATSSSFVFDFISYDYMWPCYGGPTTDSLRDDVFMGDKFSDCHPFLSSLYININPHQPIKFETRCLSPAIFLR